VTAHNMRYFEEGHYDERADRRIQLMKFVSFYDELLRVSRDREHGFHWIMSKYFAGS